MNVDREGHLYGVQVVRGSNPLAPTKRYKALTVSALRAFLFASIFTPLFTAPPSPSFFASRMRSTVVIATALSIMGQSTWLLGVGRELGVISRCSVQRAAEYKLISQPVVARIPQSPPEMAVEPRRV